MAAEVQHTTNHARVLLDPIWLEIKTCLEKEQKRIHDEIINYPPPIPACDVQFNHLLEERAGIRQELHRSETNKAGSVESIREFIGSSQYIDDALKTTLTNNLEKVLEHAIIE